MEREYEVEVKESSLVTYLVMVDSKDPLTTDSELEEFYVHGEIIREEFLDAKVLSWQMVS